MQDFNLSDVFTSAIPKPEPLKPELVELAEETLKKVLKSHYSTINPALVTVLISIIRGT